MDDTVKTKLKSDRLWALLLFLALLVGNAAFDMGLSDDQIREALYAVIAFILGKSVRGTIAGSAIIALLP